MIANQGPRRSAAGRSVVRPLPAHSSLVADPSSQGVTLRGLGPSGVSRALVLEDGVPLNDGFGGWVYWDAVARLGIARVEIAPGASSALFGSSAVGGAVEIVSRAVVDRAEVELERRLSHRRSRPLAGKARRQTGRLAG